MEGYNPVHNTTRVAFLFMASLAFTLMFTSQPGYSFEQSKQKEIMLVFRYDDYSSLSCTELEVKLIKAFRQHGLSCTFGVIPYVCAGDAHDSRQQEVIALSTEKAGILRDAIKQGTVDVAQHGYSHQTNRDKAVYTEFAGLEYNTQFERMAKGKNFLEEAIQTRITTFIPPWNTYDANTLAVLEKLEFTCLSAGSAGNVNKSCPLKFLPATCGLLRMQDAVRFARHVPETHPVIVVLFHEFSFVENNAKRGVLSYEEFCDLLNWVTHQNDVKVRSINRAVEEIKDLSARRYGNYISWVNSCANVRPVCPPFLVKKFWSGPDNVYLSASVARSIDTKSMKVGLYAATLLFYAGTFLICGVIAFFVSLSVCRRSVLTASILKYGGLALFVLVSVYALHNLNLGYKGGIAVCVMLGGDIGMWFCFVRTRRRGLARAE